MEVYQNKVLKQMCSYMILFEGRLLQVKDVYYKPQEQPIKKSIPNKTRVEIKWNHKTYLINPKESRKKGTKNREDRNCFL